jgi:hypothetical protein
VAHFAELDENNTVLRVIVVDDQDTADADGNESEVIGVAFCENLLGGRWIQTSYNDNFRKQYAGIGSTYDQDADVFIDPQPYPSWSLDENHAWQPPIPHPNDGNPYVWDEENQTWKRLEDD